MGPIQADSRLGPQVDQLKLKVSRLEEECALLRRARGPPPGAEEKEREQWGRGRVGLGREEGKVEIWM